MPYPVKNVVAQRVAAAPGPRVLNWEYASRGAIFAISRLPTHSLHVSQSYNVQNRLFSVETDSRFRTAGLWTMCENARVMLEMADYAARNSAFVDRELLAALRSDAMQIRVCVLTALAKY